MSKNLGTKAQRHMVAAGFSLRTNDLIIAPSILSANFANLEKDIKTVERAGADWLHVDVMDGHFVPNLTIGPPVVKAISKCTKLPLDVHLMISDPGKYAPDFARAGTWLLTFHIETCRTNEEAIRLIRKIKSLKMKTGISIKPHTPISRVLPFLHQINMVMVMTVEPGFGGQEFMPQMMPKVKFLRDYVIKKGLNLWIEVDGGVNEVTAKVSARSGADVFVAGNYVYGAKDPARRIRLLRHTIGSA